MFFFRTLRQNLQLLTNKTIGWDEGDQSYVIFYAKLHVQNSGRPLLPLLPPKVFFLSQNICHLPFYFPAAKLIFLFLLNSLVMADTFKVIFFGVKEESLPSNCTSHDTSTPPLLAYTRLPRQNLTTTWSQMKHCHHGKSHKNICSSSPPLSTKPS